MGVKVRKNNAWVALSGGGGGGATGGAVPSGSIIMYNGDVAPSGWTLCDGTNGSPDLRSRFIVGATSGSSLSNFYSLTVSNTGQTSWSVNGTDRNGVVSGNNPTLNFADGDVIWFTVSTNADHPFLVKTVNGNGNGNQLPEYQGSGNGVNGNGAGSFPSFGGIVKLYTLGLAGTTLYYNCENHTPMNGSIIIGASASGTVYNRADTGGSANATLVSHTHGAGSYSALSNGAHTHTYTHNNFSTTLDNDEGNSTIYPNLGTYNTGSAGAHSHSVSGSSGPAGSSATNANLPPYYALTFIMKL